MGDTMVPVVPDHLVFQYIDVKLFEFIEKQFSDLLWTSEDLLEITNFESFGRKMPVVALFRISATTVDPETWGWSTMWINGMYDGKPYKAQIIDWVARFSLMAKSYDLDFVNQVNYYTEWLDRKELVTLDFSDLFVEEGYQAKTNVRRTNTSFLPTVKEDEGERSFYINSELEFRGTTPFIESGFFYERLRLYLNNSLIEKILLREDKL